MVVFIVIFTLRSLVQLYGNYIILVIQFLFYNKHLLPFVMLIDFCQLLSVVLESIIQNEQKCRETKLLPLFHFMHLSVSRYEVYNEDF